jgi:hypothetical protein
LDFFDFLVLRLIVFFWLKAMYYEPFFILREFHDGPVLVKDYRGAIHSVVVLEAIDFILAEVRA